MASLRVINGRYYIRVWIKGREKCFPTGTSVLSDAKRQLKKFQGVEIEIKQKIRDDWEHPALGIDKAIKLFMGNIQMERNLRDKTLEIYESALKHFQNCFEHYENFGDFEKTDISVLMRYLTRRYNPISVNIYLRSTRSFLNYLYEKELIKNLPFKIKQVRVDSKKPKFITPQELDKIYSVVSNPKMLSTFRIYEVTGMRLRELYDSVREGQYIRITKSKARKERIVPIPENNIYDYEIARKDPFNASSISHAFHRACKKVGIKKSIHCLRHTYAIRKLLECNNIVVVKELMGHSSVSVTEMYLQFPTGYLKEIFQKKQIVKEPIIPTEIWRN